MNIESPFAGRLIDLWIDLHTIYLLPFEILDFIFLCLLHELRLNFLVPQPTKDRVRKSRKAKDGQGNPVESKDDKVSNHPDFVLDSTDTKSERFPLPPTSIPSSSNAWGSSVRSEPPSPGLDDHSADDRNMKQRWAERPLIGIKPTSSPRDATQIPPVGHRPARNSMVGRLALPGLTSEEFRTKESASRQDLPSPQLLPSRQSEYLAIPDIPESSTAISPTRRSFDASATSGVDGLTAEQLSSKESLTSPAISIPAGTVITPRHTRTPSSGNRTTAMDVAQALNGQLPSPSSPGWMEHRVDPSTWDETPSNTIGSTVEEATKHPVGSRRTNISALHAEKRKSSYEKYSAIMLPPLKEEVTPVTSPAGTLARSAIPPTKEIVSRQITDVELAKKLEQVPQADLVTSPAESGDMVYFSEHRKSCKLLPC